MTGPTTETAFSTRMTEAEALMWNVEKDPWLSATMGTILLTDGPIDIARLRRKVADAVATIPRLRERAVPQHARMGPPQWRTDREFDFDHHVRHVALPSAGSMPQLLEFANHLFQDPFDRTRPLWQFVVVDGVERGGVEGGGSALLLKLHHTIADGQGAVKLAERYLDFAADAPLPDPVDLDAIIGAAASAEAQTETESSHTSPARDALGWLGERQLTMARRVAGEVGMTFADPERIPDAAEAVGAGLRSAFNQLAPSDTSQRSPLWATRSRRRHLSVFDLDLDAVKNAAKALGGTINDFFVTGALIGAAHYHDEADCPVEQLTVSFIVSTRHGRSEGGNAFTPTKAVLPAGPMTPVERFDVVRRQLSERRDEVSGAGLMSSLSGVANLLPTSVTTRAARAQAGTVDFATSNVRAAPFEVFVAGSKLVASYPVGPVAGTAFNLTMMSYNGQIHFGLHVDPVAVTDPQLLQRAVASAYATLLDAANDG